LEGVKDLMSKNYRDFRKTTLSKDYSLKDQMLRSSGSVMDNIAEGFERNGNKEFLNFLSISKGSLGETRSQTYRLFDSKHVNETVFNDLLNYCLTLSSKIGGFMNYLAKSDYKGTKFKKR
jgi:four helix bundle protein